MRKIIASVMSIVTLSILCSCQEQYEVETVKYEVANTSTVPTVAVEEIQVATQTTFSDISYENTDIEVFTETDNENEIEEINSDYDPSAYDPYDDMSFDGEIPESYYIEGAEVVYQNPELPTGCEITSLTMLLNYWGYDIDKMELCEDYLEKNYDYSCTFNDAFIGNPENGSGYGCFAPVIARTAYKFLSDMGSDLKVHNISGKSLDDIFYYIAEDRPVVIWASMSLVDIRYYLAWTLEDGEEVWWYENEHCLLLTGYDYEDRTVTVCDPLKGEYVYDMDRFEEIYDQLEQQAVTIY